jgi:hypothetical protein
VSSIEDEVNEIIEEMPRGRIFMVKNILARLEKKLGRLEKNYGKMVSNILHKSDKVEVIGAKRNKHLVYRKK